MRPLAVLGSFGLTLMAVATAAVSAGAEESHGHAALTATVFARAGVVKGGVTVSKPDDITSLGSRVFVAWQNGVGPKGEPAGSVTDSTVVEYSRHGRVLASWQLAGRVDGMSADPAHDRIIATVNEDGNSSLYVIKLGEEGSKLVHYTYSPNPPVHGGGTDAPHIYRGQLLISASNPSDSTQPAVYRATLAGKTATLTPVFFDDSLAAIANTNDPARGTMTALALSDPDSNNVVPRSSPRFGGDFLLDSQGDGQQIYVQGAGTSSQKLFLLNLSGAGASTAVDDTVWATSPWGTLYATDGSSTVYAIHGRFVRGTAFSSVSPANANTPGTGPNWLATLDLRTGALSPVAGVTIHPKGLLFVGAEGED